MASTLDFDVAVPKCPQTAERKQAADAENILSKPGVARANLAVSTEVPDGSPDSAGKYRDYVSFYTHLIAHEGVRWCSVKGCLS